jgi:hypothetical protein
MLHRAQRGEAEDLLCATLFLQFRAKCVNQEQVLRSLRSHQDDILRSLPLASG